MDWFTDSHNFLFTIAFTIMMCFAVLEAISMLFGGGLSSWLGDLWPDADVQMDMPEIPDADPGVQPHHAAFGMQFFSWLECGKLPFLISFNAFLGAFSILGFTLQGGLQAAGLSLLPAGLAAIPAFFLALPVLKYLNRMLGRIWPSDETSAFSQDELVGRVGIVTIGSATPDRSAEIKVIGPDRRPHYVMAFSKEGIVSQGHEILLTERISGTSQYRGLPAHLPILALPSND